MDFYSHYEHLCAVQGCIPIASVLAKKSHGTLDLNADRIKAPDWAPLLTALRHNKTLTSIAIRTSHYRSHADSGVERPGTHLRRRIPPIRSKDLTSHLCKAIKGCLTISNALTNLELQGMLLREKDLILLTKGLAKTSTLQSLSLAHSQVGDGGLEIICQGVKNSACIKSIDFTGCNLTWRGTEHLANILKHQAIVRHGEAWVESLRYRRPDLDCMAGLRRITLNCNCLIGDRGAAVLAECLAEDLWLKALDLQQCGITNVGAKSFLEAFNTNTTLVVLDIRKNPLVDHALVELIIEKVLMNVNGMKQEYQWLSSPISKDSKSKPKKRTLVLGNGRKGKATIRIGFTSKKSVSPGKTTSCDQDSYAPKPLPPGTCGFLPWRTAERAKLHRASSLKDTHEFPLKIKAGVPVKVTVESATTSEAETDGAIEETATTQSPEIIDLTHCHNLEMDYEECQLKLKEEQKARLTAEERIMELQMENTRLRNLSSSLSEALQAQSVASTILDDEGVLGSIESSFKKFHAFLDLLKDAGLGQLAAMAGIDQSDFGLLRHPQMTSSLIKQREKSFEEERQEHMQHLKNAGSVSFSSFTHFQSDLSPFPVVNNVLPAVGRVQEFQPTSSCLQSSWPDSEGKIKHWLTEEKTSKNSQAVSSEKNGQSVELHTREPSMRHPVTYQHSLSEPSVHHYSETSKSARASEHSIKLSSQILPRNTSVAARGDQSIHKNDPSRNDTMESDSDIQESIHSISSL